jgi:hypothetical protein
MKKHIMKLLIASLTFGGGVASTWLRLGTAPSPTGFAVAQVQPASRVAETPDNEVVRQLRSILPDGWSLRQSSNTVRLIRDRKVILYSTLNMDVAFCQKSGLAHEQPCAEAAREIGHEDFFSIHLRLIPKLSRAEYARFKDTQAACPVSPPAGPDFNSDQWEESWKCRLANEPPVYFTDQYSIFVERSDLGLRIYPGETATECNRVAASLDRLFQRYEKRDARGVRP